jgi:hypothetical protein
MEHFYVAVTGQASLDRPAPGLSSLLGRLRAITGSRKAAAAALGISGTTFYRWSTGQQQPKMSVATIDAVVRRASLSADREKAIRRGDYRLVIIATVKVSSPGKRGDDVRENRKLNVGDWISQRKMGNILSAWLKGDDQKAEKLLSKAIETDYQSGLELQAINRMYFRRNEV